MKQFIKMTLAVIVGLIVVTVVSTLLSLGALASLSSEGMSSGSIPESGVLKLDLSKIKLTEQTQEPNPLEAMNSEEYRVSIGILDAVNAIHAAAEDPAVKYIYLKADFNGSDAASLSELRKALAQFRISSGKAVVSYMEMPSTGGYYLASVSDKIYVGSFHGGNIMINGTSAQMLFLGDLLKELGINIQLIRHGKYKSAGEMYTRNSASPENREQYSVMINSIWASMAGEIAESRGISVAELNDIIDEMRLCLPEDLVKEGLADEVLNRGELKDKLAGLAVEDDFDDVGFIPFPDYAKMKAAVSKGHDRIAVIYADGSIIDGSDLTEVAGDRFAHEIEKVRKDKSVKAVVLRVNSPGGSVVASEKIKDELDLLGQEKILVASYGAYAASGGYWISNNCEKIYSDAVTLTGSIGVFGTVPDVGKAVKDKLKIGVEVISSNKHGDMWSLMRPLDGDETAYMQKSIEDIYDRFLENVSEGRGMEKEKVDEIAQGRVWTGTDALKIGLVDEIGGLEDALRYAATCAGDSDLSNWKITGYPRVPSSWEILLKNMTEPDDYSVLAREFENIKAPGIMARLPYSIEIKL